MRQVGDVLHEAVEWLNGAMPFCRMVTWRLDGLGLLGEATATAATSRHALAERNGNITSVMRGVD